jgi:ABC-type branched-subunit amino acid transport system ATPase component
MSTLLQASDLNYFYGAVHAVRGVGLTVQAGELVAMIGPNGAGKSTVFGLLSGDLKQAKCRVELNGQNISQHTVQARAAAGLGRTYQTAAPFATLTVLENFRVAATALATHSAQRLAGLETLLKDSGLNPLRNATVQNLPYADWKRLDLAMALVQQPRVLLLDEPTAGLAQQERVQMMRWVRQVAHTQGLAVLFTEHNLDAVFEYADRIIVLVRGSILAEGTPQAIAANPQVQAAYTGNYTMKPAQAPLNVTA